MLKLFRNLVVAGFTAGLGACGSGNGGGGIPTPVLPTESNLSSLVGQWESTVCEDNGNSTSQDVLFTFDDDFTGSLIFRQFLGSNCLLHQFDVISPLTYLEGRTTVSSDGGIQTELDLFPTESTTIVIELQIVADGFNEIAACGITNWEVGVSFEIFGCTIGRIEVVQNFPFYTIYRIGSDDLFYEGTEPSFTTINRPNTLFDRPTYTRLRTTNDGRDFFPQDVSGLWVLPGGVDFYRFSEDGTWTTYTRDMTRGCYEVRSAQLIDEGNDQYSFVSGELITIRPANNQLEFGAGVDSSGFFDLRPAERTALFRLDFCRP